MARAPNLDLRQSMRPVVVAGQLIIFLFFVVFGGWLAFAPLSSAAVATGVVSPQGSRRAVQHLEGGIIRTLKVKDGDYVKPGDPLVILDDTQAVAQYHALKTQLIRLKAIRARLVALQTNTKTLEFPTDVREAAENDAELTLFLKAQEELFATRQTALISRKEMMDYQVQQISTQITGLEAELKGNTEQLAYIDDELAGLNELLASGNALKSRVLQLQRARSEIASKVSASRASIASAQQKISEVRVGILNTDIEFRDKVADEAMRINSEIAQLEERVAASRDVLDRTVVRAPVEGTVVGLRFKTQHGVIRPGDAILSLVPMKEELVIDARVQPIDGKSIRAGQMAEVHLLPYSQRNMPSIQGKVLAVSADTLTDERTNERYYEAKILVEKQHLAVIAPEVELTAGMPADVLIITGERSALRYIFEPIERSFRLSFRQD